jgi:hypothetical protein
MPTLLRPKVGDRVTIRDQPSCSGVVLKVLRSTCKIKFQDGSTSSFAHDDCEVIQDDLPLVEQVAERVSPDAAEIVAAMDNPSSALADPQTWASQESLEAAGVEFEPVALSSTPVQHAAFPIDSISSDVAALQIRGKGIDPNVVAEYAALWEAYGDHCPLSPIKLMQVEDKYWLYDGAHTLEAAKQVGRSAIPAIVRRGSFLDAQIESCFTNCGRGAPLTNLDKQRAAKRAIQLLREKGEAMSDRALGSRLGIDHKTVSKYRRELEGVVEPQSKPSPNGHTFEAVQQAYAEIGHLRRTSDPKFRYELECVGQSHFFRGLDEAMRKLPEFEARYLLAELEPVEGAVSGEIPHLPAEGSETERSRLVEESPTGEIPHPTIEQASAVSPQPQATNPHYLKVSTSSKTDEHNSPREVIEAVMYCFSHARQVEHAISLDPCSNSLGAAANVPAAHHFTIRENGLNQDWREHRTLYLNPPYSDVKAWVTKLILSMDVPHSQIEEAIILTKADTSTEWFSLLWLNATAFCFFDHRLKFGDCEQSAPFPSAIAYFGSEVQDFYRAFSPLGEIVQVLEPEMFTRTSDTFGSPHPLGGGGKTNVRF